MREPAAERLRRVEREVEERARGLAESGALRGLDGEGRPLPDDGGPADTWAARRIVRNANAVPPWADLRREIDGRTARLRLRIAAHHGWLRDRARYLAEVPAERVVEVSRVTTERDRRVRRELADAVSELNGLVRRYDLMVVPAMQLPLVTLERLGLDDASARQL